MTSTATPATPPATRIARRFAELRQQKQMGLVAFLTAGDPNLAATESFVLAMAEAGADVIELGVPFSDPLADGPVIQRSSERALRSGTTLAGVLDLVASIRRKSDVALVLFSYYNPVLQMGLEKFADRAAAAGADGVLITDMTPEEAGDYRRIVILARAGHDFSGRADFDRRAPGENCGRYERIPLSYFAHRRHRHEGHAAGGFAGAGASRARVTSLPIAVGFGISLPGHVSVLGGLADAAVVGSALVQEIERAANVDAARAAVAERVRMLKQAGLHGMSRREPGP